MVIPVYQVNFWWSKGDVSCFSWGVVIILRMSMQWVLSAQLHKGWTLFMFFQSLSGLPVTNISTWFTANLRFCNHLQGRWYARSFYPSEVRSVHLRTKMPSILPHQNFCRFLLSIFAEIFLSPPSPTGYLQWLRIWKISWREFNKNSLFNLLGPI